MPRSALSSGLSPQRHLLLGPSFARRGVELPLPSADRSCDRTSTGLSCSAPSRYELVGCLLYPGTTVTPHDANADRRAVSASQQWSCVGVLHCSDIYGYETSSEVHLRSPFSSPPWPCNSQQPACSWGFFTRASHRSVTSPARLAGGPPPWSLGGEDLLPLECLHWT